MSLRDLIGSLVMLPSHKWLSYFRLSLRDKEADGATSLSAEKCLRHRGVSVDAQGKTAGGGKDEELDGNQGYEWNEE
jgi:hypothetical protein